MATKNAQFIQSDQCLLQNGSNYILNNILKNKTNHDQLCRCQQKRMLKVSEDTEFEPKQIKGNQKHISFQYLH